MTATKQRVKDDVVKPLSYMCTEVQKAFQDMVGAVKRKIRADLDDVWKKIETHLQVEFDRFVVSVGDELLSLSSTVQSFLRKSTALLSSRVVQALDAGSRNNSSSVGTKKTKKTRDSRIRSVRRNLLRVRRAVTT